MQISTQKTSNHILKGQQGFSLIEILVALLLAALVFLIVPSSDTVQKHRDLKSDLDNLERAIQFAGNESVLRNTVVRLRISLDKSPTEYTVEYGPAGNMPLPEMPKETENLSLAEQKALQEKSSQLDKNFTKVSEFEDIKQELHPDVTVLGLASTAQKGIKKKGESNIYFYPTGEKDGALIFLSTVEEIAYIEVQPFLSETKTVFHTLNASSVAKLEDILQTKMDEVYREWGR